MSQSTIRKRRKKSTTVPEAPPAPGIDRTPDVTMWLAKWANLTAAIRALCHESSLLACAARPGAFAYQPHVVKALGIDRENLDKFDSDLQSLHGYALVPPFRGTLLPVGDGMLEEAAEKKPS